MDSLWLKNIKIKSTKNKSKEFNFEEMILSGEALKKVCTTLSSELSCQIATIINEVSPLYGMGSADILREFIANCAEESGEFQRLSENLNYSVKVLLERKIFSKKRITDEQIQKYGRKEGQPANQEMLANILYGGEFGRIQLGNTNPRDGWLLRGAGWIQITGRRNMTLFCDFYNKKFNTRHTVLEMAMKIRTDHYFAAHSACWVFAIAKNLIPYAIGDDNENFTTIVRKINGGVTNLPKRKNYFNLAKIHIK